jgi:hypothetical protein
MQRCTLRAGGARLDFFRRELDRRRSQVLLLSVKRAGRRIRNQPAGTVRSDDFVIFDDATYA